MLGGANANLAVDERLKELLGASPLVAVSGLAKKPSDEARFSLKSRPDVSPRERFFFDKVYSKASECFFFF